MPALSLISGRTAETSAPSGSGARNAQEIARLAAGFFRDGEAQRDAAVGRVRRCVRRRAASSTAATSSFARTLAVPAGRTASGTWLQAKPVHGFIHRAVAAADDHELPRLLDGAARHDGRFAGSRRVLQFRFDSGVAENAARLVELPHARGRLRRWD